MKLDDATLMAFHDGELDAESEQHVRLALLEDLEAARRLAGLEQLGAFVRVWASARGAAPVRVPQRRDRARTRVRASRARGVSAGTGRAFGVALGLFGLTLLIPGQAPRVSESGDVAATGSRGVLSLEARRVPLAAEPAVAVESVDFGARGGEIFLVESAKSETTVVWLKDDPAPGATGTL
jgi:anti-sigma factor RsiW